MITLADYLDYLNAELLNARKKADEAALTTARAYAEHEYLQHFRAPRFTMPVVKLRLPIRIDDIDQKTKFDFKIRPQEFVAKLNERFTAISRKYDKPVKPMTLQRYQSDAFQQTLKRLEDEDRVFLARPDALIDINTTRTIYDRVFAGGNLRIAEDDPALQADLQQALHQTLSEQFRPVATQLDRIAITPQAGSMREGDNEKLLVQLDIEMVEEGLRIRYIKDENGNIIREELIVD